MTSSPGEVRLGGSAVDVPGSARVPALRPAAAAAAAHLSPRHPPPPPPARSPRRTLGRVDRSRAPPPDPLPGLIHEMLPGEPGIRSVGMSGHRGQHRPAGLSCRGPLGTSRLVERARSSSVPESLSRCCRPLAADATHPTPPPAPHCAPLPGYTARAPARAPASRSCCCCTASRRPGSAGGWVDLLSCSMHLRLGPPTAVVL